MTYPISETATLDPQKWFDVTFRPTVPGLIKLIATASFHVDAPAKTPPGEPNPIDDQLGVRVQLFAPGVSAPVLDIHEAQHITSDGDHDLLLWRDYTAVDVGGDWRVRLTATGTLPTACALTVRFPTVTGPLGKIDHVVVLMLENRSFDHMLGFLSLTGGRTDVDGLTGHETNRDTNGEIVAVYPATSTAFKDDPHHGWPDVKVQLDHGNQGFVQNFATIAQNEPHKAVMSYQTPATVPTFASLAEAFVVCDRWFAALPTDTWPNRLYAMTGGSGGSITTPSDATVATNPPGYTLRTIFEVLQAHGVAWNVFFSDVSFTLIFKKIVQDAQYTARVRALDSFYERAKAGDLPSFTWLEPNYNDLQGDHFPTDDHPPTDVTNAQALVAQIYNALVQSPAWTKTLFVVTYDEHGGFYDHVTPPGTDPPTIISEALAFPSGSVVRPPATGTPPPDDDPALRRYGVRVPALVISPWVAARTCAKTTFDHTSVLKTVLARFCTDEQGKLPSMGARTDGANHLGPLLANTEARTDAPASLPVPPLQSIPFSYASAGETRPSPPGFATVLRRFLIGI